MAQPGVMVLSAMTPPTPTMASATCTEPLQRTAWRWSWCRCGCHCLCPCLSSQTLKRLLALPLEDAGAPPDDGRPLCRLWLCSGGAWRLLSLVQQLVAVGSTV
jgi:hypothetical protein